MDSEGLADYEASVEKIEKPKTIDLKLGDSFRIDVVDGRYVNVYVNELPRYSHTILIKSGKEYDGCYTEITRNNFGVKIQRLYICFKNKV